MEREAEAVAQGQVQGEGDDKRGIEGGRLEAESGRIVKHALAADEVPTFDAQQLQTPSPSPRRSRRGLPAPLARGALLLPEEEHREGAPTAHGEEIRVAKNSSVTKRVGWVKHGSSGHRRVVR